jgi:DNA-binding transcriptional LysR family regulator
LPTPAGLNQIAPVFAIASWQNPAPVRLDLHLSDAMTDVIGEGFDAAIRIAVQPGASLAVQRLSEIPRYLVGSPAYLDKHGRPKHPLHLTEHRCIGYSYTMNSEARAIIA